MELEKFITATLNDIVNGIKNVNKGLGGGDKFSLKNHDEISFDIAITVTDGSEKSGGASIRVYALELGGKKAGKTINENVSRIKFKIKPIGNII
jgi:hypothetical protein